MTTALQTVPEPVANLAIALDAFRLQVNHGLDPKSAMIQAAGALDAWNAGFVDGSNATSGLAIGVAIKQAEFVVGRLATEREDERAACEKIAHDEHANCCVFQGADSTAARAAADILDAIRARKPGDMA